MVWIVNIEIAEQRLHVTVYLAGAHRDFGKQRKPAAGNIELSRRLQELVHRFHVRIFDHQPIVEIRAFASGSKTHRVAELSGTHEQAGYGSRGNTVFLLIAELIDFDIGFVDEQTIFRITRFIDYAELRAGHAHAVQAQFHTGIVALLFDRLPGFFCELLGRRFPWLNIHVVCYQVIDADFRHVEDLSLRRILQSTVAGEHALAHVEMIALRYRAEVAQVDLL